MRLSIEGKPQTARPTLFVANHVSYLDIPVLGALIDGVFVAKADVAEWPVFGVVAKLTRTIFINRVGGEALKQRDEMLTRLSEGENLILFAEGTTTDGSRVAPFKSSLFSVAQRPPPGVPLSVQPVSIAYVRYADGTPLTGDLRALYCWFGNAHLGPHLFRVFGIRGAEVRVTFHAPIDPAAAGSRKELARLAHGAVSAGVAMAHGIALEEGPAIAGDLETAQPVSAAPPEAAGDIDRSERAVR